MTDKTTLDAILGDFDPTDASPTEQSRRAVTIWLPPKDKARYDRLQERSGKRFSKKARELLLAMIEIAEKRAG